MIYKLHVELIANIAKIGPALLFTLLGECTWKVSTGVKRLGQMDRTIKPRTWLIFSGKFRCRCPRKCRFGDLSCLFSAYLPSRALLHTDGRYARTIRSGSFISSCRILDMRRPSASSQLRLRSEGVALSATVLAAVFNVRNFAELCLRSHESSLLLLGCTWLSQPNIVPLAR